MLNSAGSHKVLPTVIVRQCLLIRGNSDWRIYIFDDCWDNTLGRLDRQEVAFFLIIRSFGKVYGSLFLGIKTDSHL